jgi:AcrR family transcriptional regulator
VPPVSTELPRATSRERLERAVLDLLDAATLDDLLRFISVRQLVDQTGLSNGAIYRVSKGPGALARAATLKESVAFGEPTALLLERLVGVEANLRAGLDETRLAIARAGAENVFGWATGSGRIEFTATLLIAAVAMNDPDAAERMREYYEQSVHDYAAILREMMVAWRRELLEEFEVEDMAVLQVSLADGLAFRARFDPRITPELVAGALQVVWSGMTRRMGTLDDDLAIRLGVDPRLPEVVEPDDERRTAMVRAVNDLYQRRGWSSVTLTGVAERVGTNRAAVRNQFGDRDGLAVAVWSRFVAGLQRAGDRVHGRSVIATIEEYLIEVVARAQEHPEVTESLLRTFRTRDLRVADEGSSARAPIVDPRAAVPIAEGLYAVLATAPDQFRQIGADSRRSLFNVANQMCEASLARAVLQPLADPVDIVSFTTALSLDGMAKRRRRSEGTA